MAEERNSRGTEQRRQLLSLIARFLEAEQPAEPGETEMLTRTPEAAGLLHAISQYYQELHEPDPIGGNEEETIASDAGGGACGFGPSGDAVRSAASAIGTRNQAGEQRPVPGDSIRYFGDYLLLEEIARGGMGIVWKALQTKLNRTVAIKVMLSGQLAGEEEIQRFHAEAEAAANLDHPGIVPIFEVGEHGGQHYFSMGFVEGHSLADRVQQGPVPPMIAAELAKSIGEAVAYAHEKGVIHRDLKPANVLMDNEGRPKVTDFGLAKCVEGSSGLTATGQVLGTPSYMPPEQAAGRIDQVGVRSDVYALGATLYCLLTGRPPFYGSNPMETLMQVLEQDPVPPRMLAAKVPRDLETICLTCLQKEPQRRYASAQAVVSDLERCLRGEPIHARRVSHAERCWRWCRRRPLPASLIGALAAVVLIGFGAVAVQWQRAERNVGRLSHYLTAIIKDSNTSIGLRRQAASALWELDQKAAPILPTLVEALKSDDRMTVLIAMDVLEEMGPQASSAAPTLFKILEGRWSTGASVRGEAAEVLYRMGRLTQRHIPDLLAVLVDLPTQEQSELTALLDRLLPDPIAAARRHIIAISEKHPGGQIWATDFMIKMSPSKAAALAVMVPALNDENPQVQQWAIRCVTKLGPAAKPAIAPLQELARQPDQPVRTQAQLALQAIQDDLLRPHPNSSDGSPWQLSPLWSIAAAGAVMLAWCGVRMVPASRRRGNSSMRGRQATCALIGAATLITASGLACLANQRRYPLHVGSHLFRLRYGNEAVRNGAADAMVDGTLAGGAGMRYPHALACLTSLEEGLLNDSHRSHALFALQWFDDDDIRPESNRNRRVVRLLTHLMADPQGSMRKHAAMFVVRFPPQNVSAVPALTVALKDGQTCYVAARTLGEIGSASALPALADLKASPDRALRAEAMYAIHRIAMTTGQQQHDVTDELVAMAILDAILADDRTSNHLASSLDVVLVEMGMPAILALVPALREESDVAQAHAARLLGRTAGHMLEGRAQVGISEQRQREFVEIESKLHEAQILPSLLQSLADESPQVREAAASALNAATVHMEPGPDAVADGLAAALGDGTDKVRLAAATALADRFPNDQRNLAAIPTLLEGAASQTGTRRGTQYLRVLQNLARQAGAKSAISVEHLSGILTAEDFSRRFAAAYTLAFYHPYKAKPAVPMLVEGLGHKSPFIRDAAVDALQHIGRAAQPALPTLQSLANKLSGRGNIESQRARRIQYAIKRIRAARVGDR